MKVTMFNSRWAFVFRKEFSLQFLSCGWGKKRPFLPSAAKSENIMTRSRTCNSWWFLKFMWTSGSPSCAALIDASSNDYLCHYQNTEFLTYDSKPLLNSCNFNTKSLTPLFSLYRNWIKRQKYSSYFALFTSTAHNQKIIPSADIRREWGLEYYIY